MICQHGSTSGAYFACHDGLCHSESRGGAFLAGPGTEKGFSFLLPKPLSSPMTCLLQPATLSQRKSYYFYPFLCPAHVRCLWMFPGILSKPGIVMNDSVICQLLPRRHRCSASCVTVVAAMAIAPAASPACVAPRLLPFTSVVRSLQICRCHDGITRRRLQIGRLCSAFAQSSGEILTSSGGAAKESEPSALTTPFHLAIPVHDIHAAREFFGGVLGCPEGRSAKTWVDFNLFGHQVVCHEVRDYNASSSANAVDGDPVPVPHFGLAMSVPEFQGLAERVRAAGIKFIIEPHIRFVGQPGEQWTMFFKDSSGNALEFKAMTTPSNLFAKYVVE